MASMKIIFAQVFSNLTWKMASLMMAIGLWVVIRVAVVEENEASRADQGLLASREFTEVPIIVQTSSTDTNRYVIEPQTVRIKVQLPNPGYKLQSGSKCWLILPGHEPKLTSKPESKTKRN